MVRVGGLYRSSLPACLLLLNLTTTTKLFFPAVQAADSDDLFYIHQPQCLSCALLSLIQNYTPASLGHRCTANCLPENLFLNAAYHFRILNNCVLQLCVTYQASCSSCVHKFGFSSHILCTSATPFKPTYSNPNITYANPLFYSVLYIILCVSVLHLNKGY